MKLYIYVVYGSWLSIMLIFQVSFYIYFRMEKEHNEKMEIKERQDKAAAERERQENQHAKYLAEQQRIELERAKIEADSKKAQDELKAKMERERPKLLAEEAAIREKERLIKEKKEKISSIKNAMAEYELTFPIPGQNGKTIDQVISEVNNLISMSTSGRRNQNNQQLISLRDNLESQRKSLVNNGLNFAAQKINELESLLLDIDDSVIDPTVKNGSKKGAKLCFTSVANKVAAKTSTQKDIERIKKYKQVMEEFAKDLENATKE